MAFSASPIPARWNLAYSVVVEAGGLGPNAGVQDADYGVVAIGRRIRVCRFGNRVDLHRSLVLKKIPRVGCVEL